MFMAWSSDAWFLTPEGRIPFTFDPCFAQIFEGVGQAKDPSAKRGLPDKAMGTPQGAKQGSDMRYQETTAHSIALKEVKVEEPIFEEFF